MKFRTVPALLVLSFLLATITAYAQSQPAAPDSETLSATIDNSTPGTNGQGAKTVTVAYHYKLANVPAWANAAEIKTAYPNLASALNGTGTDTATLVQTGDRWEYTK